MALTKMRPDEWCWKYFGKVLQGKLGQPEDEAGDYLLFGHMAEAWKEVMWQFAT